MGIQDVNRTKDILANAQRAIIEDMRARGAFPQEGEPLMLAIIVAMPTAEGLAVAVGALPAEACADRELIALLCEDGATAARAGATTDKPPTRVVGSGGR